LVVETFDEKARAYAEGYRGGSSAAHSFNIRLRRVFELLDRDRRGRVLDVGCGPGMTVQELVKDGFEFYGVDISGEMIGQCERKFGDVLAAHFSVGRIEKLEFPNGFFDVVLCVGVVEYVDDDRVAVGEMARVVKPGGIVVVTLPNRASPYRVWQRTVYSGVRRLMRKVKGRGISAVEVVHREYSEKTCCDLLASYGLKVTDVVYYNFRVLLFPFDRMFPGLTVLLSRKMERLGRGKLRRLGTGFVVKAERM
jgi:2-polyprenyl-3-methyl-5-hydroxy-6-metoxy-1,4-benzoquinol methylase